jgi:hypothetical protein
LKLPLEVTGFVYLNANFYIFSPRAQDMSQLLYYKNLCKEDLWLDCADKLTAMIQNIIEFAKLIPGFMRLSQDDQVCKIIFKKVFIA